MIRADYAMPDCRPRRPLLPNSGRCVLAYLCAGLDAVGGCSDVNSDLSCNGSTPIEPAWLEAVLGHARCDTHISQFWTACRAACLHGT